MSDQLDDEDEDDDKRVAMCVSTKHDDERIIVEGSVITNCAKCGAEVHIAPTTLSVLESGYLDEVRCCCCTGMCDFGDVVKRIAAGDLEVHIHEFVDGVCECSMPEAEYTSEVGDYAPRVRDMLDFIGALQDGLKKPDDS